jgi:hypothetical protein
LRPSDEDAILDWLPFILSGTGTDSADQIIWAASISGPGLPTSVAAGSRRKATLGKEIEMPAATVQLRKSRLFNMTQAILFLLRSLCVY